MGGDSFAGDSSGVREIKIAYMNVGRGVAATHE